MSTPVVISAGSNVGDRLGWLQRGVRLLTAHQQVQPVAVSPVYETAPVGRTDQDDFLNLIVRARTTLDAESLLDLLHTVEAACRRERDERWGPRTLDLDLIVYGDTVHTSERLTLPHPRAHERAFVLVPWLDVEPDAQVPGHGRVADLVDAVGREGVRRRDDVRVEVAR